MSTPVPIRMPQMGESLTEGTVVRWLKRPGDLVRRDEPLVEISTDKVDTELPAPSDGRLGLILVAEGARVAVGAALALLEPASAAPEPPPADIPSPPAASGGHFQTARAAQLVSFRRDQPPPPEPTPPGRAWSPAVLSLASRSGLSAAALAEIPGTGRGQRVTRRDVERHLSSGGATAGAPRVLAEIPPEYLYRPEPDDQVAPMSPVRRRIAEHMSWSVRISPQATAFAECDMSACARLVAAAGPRFEQAVGTPLTYTALAARAVVVALKEFPSLNAAVVGDSLVLRPRIRLGIAVALPENGELVVPVVSDAEELALPGLARRIAELAARARARRLTPADVQGGTFTLTNPGIFGGVTGTPILHQPQVGIVGLGAATRRPVAVADDAIAVRSMMTISLTFDHRANDGMTGFRFLARLKAELEAPGDESKLLADP